MGDIFYCTLVLSFSNMSDLNAENVSHCISYLFIQHINMHVQTPIEDVAPALTWYDLNSSSGGITVQTT